MASARKRLTVGGFLVIALWLAAAALWQVSKARCFTLTGTATCRVDTTAPLIALSFDDGPTSAGTDFAIETLSRHGVRATFFLTGREAQQRPQLVRALTAAGHEIGNHSYSHASMILGSAATYDREIARTRSALADTGAPSTTLFRPPFGKKLVGLPWAVERQGHRMIMWDVEDPSGARDAREYARRVIEEARPGSIVLMHIMYSANGKAREALPMIIEGLRRRGLQPVTVGELLAAAR